MGKVIIDKTSNYTVISNYLLRDKRLSFKAKGMLCWMLSNSDDWDYTVAGITKCAKEGRDSIRSTLIELEKYGYLTRKRIRDESGRLGDTDYIIREIPIDIPETLENGGGEPESENHTLVNHTLGNPPQRNTILNEIPKEEGQTEDPPEEKGISKKQIDEIMTKWNSFYPKKIIRISNARLRSVNARVKEMGYEKFLEMIDIVQGTPFLCNKRKTAGKNFEFTFDWMIDANHYTKILEHKYEEHDLVKAPTEVPDIDEYGLDRKDPDYINKRYRKIAGVD